MKLRTIGMVAAAALAVFAGRAEAQDAGWDSQYAAIFGFGIDGAPMGDYDAKVGLQYNLDPQTALRFGVNINRTHTGLTESTDNANVTTTTVPGTTSTNDINLSAEYMRRFATAAVSPYAGAGAFINFGIDFQKGTDASSVTGFNPTTYNNSDMTLGFGLLGKAGVEWRINKVISLFAEYQAKVTVISRTSSKVDESQVNVGTNKTSSSRIDVLELETGVSNGGLMGVIAFF